MTEKFKRNKLELMVRRCRDREMAQTENNEECWFRHIFRRDMIDRLNADLGYCCGRL